ncbi:LysR family transcriptional regulator [Sphingopyxis sp. GW247-27LB]|uniref:LysR family transcriptional regulator n=1 Tax=Sphingopyxis sp. GW247-27LB TaxID=2012632 RepID=UPI000BA59079|nr:LysR family transcriptional regulator [Sphingopyxis sp. GW247-27LB]PAL24216.1 LysR family transcriptional regulator [Sphingopyxis sp. GW247-27LB]
MALLIWIGYRSLMDLDARPYRAFVGVADAGSFSRAARILHISQPALSAQIRELERRIGFALFTRSSRRVELTAEGSLFLDKARRMILETEFINQAAREIRANELRVGTAHHSAQIMERRDLIDSFIRANPDVPLRVHGRTHAQLFADLARNDIDIAITLELISNTGATPSVAEPFATQDVERRILAERPVCVMMPTSLVPAGQGPLTLTELHGMEVGTINRSHGIGISEAVARRLSEVGARLLHLPEADGPALAHYGALLSKPVVSLGWFGPPPPGMRECDVPDLGLSTALVVLASPAARRAGADRFLQAARH